MADMELTREQSMAVSNTGGALLVSAAAGSGKTMVLVERLMRYITDEKDPGSVGDFLIITYTNAAAAELTVHGFNVHPGAAKDTMVNAALVAMEFNAMLPAAWSFCGKTPLFCAFRRIFEWRTRVKATS